MIVSAWLEIVRKNPTCVPRPKLAVVEKGDLGCLPVRQDLVYGITDVNRT